MPNTLYLLDISSFIFRAYYAIRPLSSPSGEPTNAVFGVLQMLINFFDEAKPQHVAVAFDSKEPTVRKLKYEQYKANRSAPPEDLRPQFDRIEELLMKVMKLPSFRRGSIEADDWIATLTREWIGRSPDNRVVIVSGDKDLMQLVTDRVTLWDTMNQKHYDPAAVEAKFGVAPERIRDYLAFIGDSSDNIPGLPGVGPKTALQWLASVKGVHEFLEAIEDPARVKELKISDKKLASVLENRELLNVSYDLVGLDDHVPFTDHDLHLDYQFVIEDALLTFCRDLGFSTLADRLLKRQSASTTAVSREHDQDRGYVTIRTEAELATWLTWAKQVGKLALDCETTSLALHQAKLVGISIATQDDHGKVQAAYIPIAHCIEGEMQLSESVVLGGLRTFLEDGVIDVIGQNLKYDWSVLRNHGLELPRLAADTMIAGWCLESEGRYNLEALARKYLDRTTMTFEEVCGKGKDQKSFADIPIDVATRYSAEDAHYAWLLWEKFEPELSRQNLMPLFQKFEMPLVMALGRMELEGITIDLEWFKQLSVIFTEELRELEQRVRSFSRNPELNLMSPKQLQVLLFEELKLPTQTKTKTGFSTDADVLEILAPLHEVPRLLLEFREISKLLGTYVDPLPELVDPKTCRLHSSFHQTGTSTGRLSSSDPNLQNIPIRSKRGLAIRKGFIPRNGWTLIAADYSQIELRVLAELSRDQELTRAFQSGEDVHRQTAGEIFGVAPAEVSDEQRRVAKAINFGLMYGKTAFGLAKELGISRRDAQTSIEAYFVRYSGVKAYLDAQVRRAHEEGVVETYFGRKRTLNEIHSKNPALRGMAERVAMNSPIQGTAADLMKLAMIRVDAQIRERKLESRLLLQVHDEFILEAPPAEVEAVQQLVREAMENVVRWTVPLSVNVAVGSNWQEV